MSPLKARFRSLIHRLSHKEAQIPVAGKQTSSPSTEEYFTPAAVALPSAQNQQQHKPTRAVERAAMIPTAHAATVSGTLEIDLINNSSSNQVYAYITGIALDNNNAVFLLQSDAKTPYYPASPTTNGASLSANVSISLGAPGTKVTATIPRLAGARIWFSIGTPLKFFVNPGPGLVEPSVFNPSDPNYNTSFSFCEFTFNTSQLFVNISYVDFVSDVPIALSLNDTSGGNQRVRGMPVTGLATVCAGLRAQTAQDGRRWSSLIVEKNGANLRALSPNSGIIGNPSWFQTYWSDYVNSVWNHYKTTPLTVDTQASFGKVKGTVNSSGNLDFGNGSTFAKPTAGDIFSNSSGPFATGSNGQTNAIIPRLAAAFNRSILLLSNETPNGTPPNQYYTAATTNHYARIVHATNLDGLGYAFPYDDVAPDGGAPQEGAIFSFAPTTLTVAVGGNNA